tara:strand:- start:1978 stop:2295 length:318 start_codon:yes stop_codon:yes gene_type:complete
MARMHTLSNALRRVWRVSIPRRPPWRERVSLCLKGLICRLRELRLRWLWLRWLWLRWLWLLLWRSMKLGSDRGLHIPLESLPVEPLPRILDRRHAPPLIRQSIWH